MAAMVDRKRRRRRVVVTAVLLALVAAGFYAGFIISVALRS
ncbi:hypothetical protein [Thioalkalivibrio nitratireducens]|nr:hypothetical protein [Thioalkalivibrio nitratireducens]